MSEALEYVLQRRPSKGETTIGVLTANAGEARCYVVEDQVRTGPKVKGKTAIPAGRYQIKITNSPRFGRPMPLLLNVPNYEGIRIHPGNTKDDTEGCLCPGRSVSPDGLRVNESVAAYTSWHAEIARAEAAGREVWITIKNG